MPVIRWCAVFTTEKCAPCSMTGLAMSYALLAGLTQARATGAGRDMDVSLFDVALNNTNYLASWYRSRVMVRN